MGTHWRTKSAWVHLVPLCRLQQRCVRALQVSDIPVKPSDITREAAAGIDDADITPVPNGTQSDQGSVADAAATTVPAETATATTSAAAGLAQTIV